MHLNRSRLTFRLLLVLAALSATSAAAFTVKCESVAQKTGKKVKWGTEVSTSMDAKVASLCSGSGWESALDNWRYGDFYPMYSSQPKDVTDTDRRLFSQSNSQPAMTRKICWDGDDSAEMPKKNFVGAYAWEYISKQSGDQVGLNRGTLKIHVLCTGSYYRGQGVGLGLLNMALEDGYGKVLDGQRVTLSILAHPKAESFYNGLVLDCQAEDAGKTYVATMTKDHAVERKRGCAQMDGPPIRIKYGCVELAEYHRFVEQVEEQGVIDNEGDSDGIDFLSADDCDSDRSVETFSEAWLRE